MRETTSERNFTFKQLQQKRQLVRECMLSNLLENKKFICLGDSLRCKTPRKAQNRNKLNAGKGVYLLIGLVDSLRGLVDKLPNVQLCVFANSRFHLHQRNIELDIFRCLISYEYNIEK